MTEAKRAITALTESQLRPLRRDLQMIFQDPFASLNPLHRIVAIVGDPLLVHGERDPSVRRRPVAEMLDRVGLPASLTDRFPRGLSGGQRQRVGIARALIMHPRLVVADEPVSGLDVSVQAQVVNLLEDLQDELGLTYVVISHDLAVVRQIADRIGVMYLGRLVELCDSGSLYTSPLHPLHRGAPFGGGDPGPPAQCGSGADCAAGRRSQPGQSTDGMPLPHPLPPRLRPVRAGRPAADRGRPRPTGRLPLPALGGPALPRRRLGGCLRAGQVPGTPRVPVLPG
jgi:ABC-type dipeptide/oligopeptide/nickel transport system ATPase subunit